MKYFNDRIALLAVPQLEFEIRDLKEKSKELSKISGAYVLIKKLKDRIKTLDSALQIMDRSKTELKDFQALQAKVNENQALAIFQDMKLMQEITSKNLVQKLESDMSRLQTTFENRLTQQKMVHSAFEKKYTVTVIDRI